MIYHQCNDCGIIWRDPASFHMEKEYDQNYFDSKDYEQNRQHKISKSGWLIDLALSLNPNISSMLEVGCSLGNTLEAAKLRGVDHLGIDVSSFAVEYCRKHGLNASNQTLEQLVDENQKYQLIYIQHVLEHFQDPFQVLRMVHKLLDAQGLLVILIPNSNYSRAKKLRASHKFYSKDGVGLEHYVYFNYQNLIRSLEQLNFITVQKNYPLRPLSRDSLGFYINRLGRLALSVFNLDQELVLVAQSDQI